jgi:hypothetical protein
VNNQKQQQYARKETPQKEAQKAPSQEAFEASGQKIQKERRAEEALNPEAKNQSRTEPKVNASSRSHASSRGGVAESEFQPTTEHSKSSERKNAAAQPSI